MRFLSKSIKIVWKELATLLLAIGFLSYIAFTYKVSFPIEAIRGLLGVKIAVVSITISTLLFYYKFFYEDAAKLNLRDYPKLLSYYFPSMVTLSAIAFAMFVSLSLDMYIVLFSNDLRVQAVSLGGLLVALVGFFMLLISIFARAFAEMQTLKEAAEMR